MVVEVTNNGFCGTYLVGVTNNGYCGTYLVGVTNNGYCGTCPYTMVTSKSASVDVMKYCPWGGAGAAAGRAGEGDWEQAVGG
jgi:hypothetical protein